MDNKNIKIKYKHLLCSTIFTQFKHSPLEKMGEVDAEFVWNIISLWLDVKHIHYSFVAPQLN